LVKKVAHHFLSSGVITLTLTRLNVHLYTIVAGSVVGYLTDTIIDRVGHSKVGERLDRNSLTHSILTAPTIGILLGLGSSIFLNHGFALVLAGFLAGVCHLLADSLTEAGVFAPFSRRRLCSLPFDDWLLNLALSMFGGLLLAYGFLASRF